MAERLEDRLHRPLNDLRVSLTDRCQFRCNYCLPAEYENVMRQQRSQHLTFEEIIWAISAFSKMGVTKVRLTGGEPLLRKGLPELIQNIKNIDGIKDLAMTTNAALLQPILSALIAAGLDRITISLDAIDDKLFKVITGTQQSVNEIIDQIFRCAASDLKAVKVNCVVQRGINEHQIIPMLELFRNSRVEVRFIEFMDVGNINEWQASKVYPTSDILSQIKKVWPFNADNNQQSKPVANRYKYADTKGTFGTIASITEPFCHDCNRARLSADGSIYTCLFSQKGHNIRPFLSSPKRLEQEIKRIWTARKDQYSELRRKQGSQKNKRIEMFVIGG